MLQQTPVATVKRYFGRFLQAFPTIGDLARADEQEVLRIWEGLGYYRRARHLHQAARRILDQHGGRFPRDLEAVSRLPGIGRYTARAILSIAFDARQPILEANTTRLFIRLAGYGGDPGSAAARRALWTMAEGLLPQRNVGQFNQALMELGSTVCVPRRPRCPRCPVARLCRACRLGIAEQIPASRPKPPPQARHEAALLVCRKGRVLLLRCAEGGRWAGLWDFPRLAVDARNPAQVPLKLVENLRQQTGLSVVLGTHLASLRHSVTRWRIRLDCYRASYLSGLPDGDRVGARWVPLGQLARYPLNSTARKLSRLLRAAERLGR